MLDSPVDRYLLTFAVVLGLGGFALAADIYARLLARRGARVLDVYAAVLAFAVLAGAVVLGPVQVTTWGSPLGWVVGVPMGLLLGWGARRADRSIVRAAARRAAARPPARALGLAEPVGRAGRVTPSRGAQLLGGTSRRDPRAGRATPSATGDARQFALPSVLAVAVVEEFFYRGVLLQVTLLPATIAIGALLVALSIGAFALSHVTFGWQHVLAKLPLGIGATVAVLACGTVLPAVVGHVWFNLSVWREIR